MLFAELRTVPQPFVTVECTNLNQRVHKADLRRKLDPSGHNPGNGKRKERASRTPGYCLGDTSKM